jgi:hypothetical protein
MEVLLYLPWQKERVLETAVANAKETFHIVTKQEAAQRKGLLIATAKTDEKGNFEFTLDEKYSKTAFDIDFICGTVPRNPPKPPRKEPIQIHLTTLYPQWRISKEQESYYYQWEYCIDSKWWCNIRGSYFDAWVICGHMYLCGTKTPIPNVKITAWDADFLTDDNLGSATTDANGHFRIDYTSIDFKQTFLSPWINVETDPGLTFKSGPDVYFKYEYNGAAIQGETAANRRNNVGYCLCVELCLDNIEIIDPPIPPSFTHFGLTRHIHIQSDIDVTTGKTNKAGFTGYAFFSSVNLIGTITKKIGGQPMEYMFEYQEVATPTTLPNPAAWLPVVPNFIDKTVIGYLWTLTGDPSNPVDYEPYFINGTGTEKTVAFNGNWIPVPQDANFAAHVDAEILKLNTEKLTGVTSIDMSMPAANIGTATVNASRPHLQNRYFAIRMKQRQANIGTGVVAGTSKPIAIFNARYNNVNKHGSWAPTTVSDQIAAVSVNIEEIISGMSGCSKIIDALHVKYSARNENLSSVSLSIVGPNKVGQSFSFPAIGLMANPETFGTTELVFTPVTDTVNDLLPCAYTVTLAATVFLTTGDGEPGGIYDFVSFCKV